MVIGIWRLVIIWLLVLDHWLFGESAEEHEQGSS
jgi:hypothetical protein